MHWLVETNIIFRSTYLKLFHRFETIRNRNYKLLFYGIYTDNNNFLMIKFECVSQHNTLNFLSELVSDGERGLIHKVPDE